VTGKERAEAAIAGWIAADDALRGTNRGGPVDRARELVEVLQDAGVILLSESGRRD
jgi:hypothetical protein